MATLWSLAFMLLSVIPHDGVARETVDLIELNHFYDEHGRLVFDQVIFYDWQRIHIVTETAAAVERGEAPPDAREERYQVRAWRLVKNPNQIPHRDWRNGGYSTLWTDGEQLRHINSKAIRETWTQYDPELVEREHLPKERRKELLTIKVKKNANGRQPAPTGNGTNTPGGGEGPPGEIPAAAQPGP